MSSANIVLSGKGTVVVQTEDELVDTVRNGQGVLSLILSVGPVKAELDATVLEFRRADEADTEAGATAKGI